MDEWVTIVKREGALLAFEGYVPAVKWGRTVFLAPFEYTRCLYLDGEVMLDSGEYAACEAFVRKQAAKDPRYLKKVFEKCVEACAETVSFMEKAAAKDLGKLGDRGLAALFAKGMGRLDLLYGYFRFHPTVDTDVLFQDVRAVLAKKHRDAGKVEELAGALSLPSKDPRISMEQKDMVRIACVRARGGDWGGAVKKHVKDYEWLSFTHFIGRPLAEEEVMERVMAVSDPERKWAEITASRRESERKIAETIQAVGGPGFASLVGLMRKFIFNRNNLKESISICQFHLRRVLYEISRRAGVPYLDLVYFTRGEIAGLLLKGTAPENRAVKERRKGFAILYEKGGLKIFTGQELEKLKAKYAKHIAEVKEIRGAIACKGRVSGTVAVVTSASQLAKVKKGDVLVASMTTADYVAAMEKAAAFVTDEGGVSCHAAIVAREFNVPCIIGTKIATKVLRDGETVEVDADNGVVRRLNRR